MSSIVARVVEHAVTIAELVGAAIMTLGAAAVLVRHLPAVLGRRLTDAGYETLRRDLGRVLLVGLEVLIVADVVRTITGTTTPTAVAMLGGIVLIRTVLSFSLDIEIDGTLPWRRIRPNAVAPPDRDLKADPTAAACSLDGASVLSVQPQGNR